MINRIRTGNKAHSSKFRVESELDKHSKENGGHISRNVVEITMKTIIRKPLMIKIIKLRNLNEDVCSGKQPI